MSIQNHIITVKGGEHWKVGYSLLNPRLFLHALFYCIWRIHVYTYCISAVYATEKKHYYYPGYRRAYRYRFEKRIIAEELEGMIYVEQEERSTVAMEKSKAIGFTGLSLLNRLSNLYNFDILNDLVFDVMHLVPLNLVKRRLEYLISNELVDVEALDAALKKIPWTRGDLCFHAIYK